MVAIANNLDLKVELLEELSFKPLLNAALKYGPFTRQFFCL